MSWIKSLVQQTSLPDQEPSPLVVVQRKLLDGYGLSDRALRPSRDINRGCAWWWRASFGALAALGFLSGGFIAEVWQPFARVGSL